MRRPAAPPAPLLQTLLSNHGVVCVSRNGSDVARLLDRPGTLLHSYRRNVTVVEEPVPNEISSSRVGGQAGRVGDGVGVGWVHSSVLDEMACWWDRVAAGLVLLCNAAPLPALRTCGVTSSACHSNATPHRAGAEQQNAVRGAGEARAGAGPLCAVPSHLPPWCATSTTMACTVPPPPASAPGGSTPAAKRWTLSGTE